MPFQVAELQERPAPLEYQQPQQALVQGVAQGWWGLLCPLDRACLGGRSLGC